jgi:orotate phosphoribosyltransferase
MHKTPRDSSALLTALPIRRGHFRLESGLHTDLWIDFEPLFLDPSALIPHIDALAERIRPLGPTAICGPFVGGALLAYALASRLGIRFYFAEKLADSDAELFGARYRVPPALAATLRDERLVVVDEAISAGSSVRATVADVQAAGATVVAIATLALLGVVGEQHFEAAGTQILALTREPLQLWKPDDCPFCQRGDPLIPNP